MQTACCLWVFELSYALTRMVIVSMEFKRSRIPIVQPCSERNAGHLTCIACIVRTVSFVWAVIHPFGGWLVVFLCECVPQRDVSALSCSCPHCIEQTMHCCTSWCRCTLSWTTRCCCPMESSPFFYILFAILSAQELKKLRWQSYFLKRTGQKKTQRR